MDVGRFGEASGGVLEVVFHTIFKNFDFLKIVFAFEKIDKFKGLSYEKNMKIHQNFALEKNSDKIA